MAADSAFELYLFTNGSWRLHLRLTEAEGGRDKAVRLAETELQKNWVEGAMVMREAFDPVSGTFNESRVFKNFKRPDLPTLGGSQRMASATPKATYSGGGRYAAGAVRRTAAREDAPPAGTASTSATGSRSQGQSQRKQPAPKKEERSLLTLLSGFASKVADLTSEGTPPPRQGAARAAAASVADGTKGAAGTRIGRYDIISELGKGAMGVVYKAYDPVIDRLVAIKTIDKRNIDDDGDALSRLRREAQSAGRLNHPNIVAIYDYGENEKFAYIAMEFVDGKTLSQVAAKCPPTVNEALGYVCQILAALDYSHERKVIHRDIKPANVMLSDSGVVKITDFGIARMESSTMTQTGALLGTPAYMSPEQVKGLVADARSDVFSTGVVLYEMLSGARPFLGSGAALVYQILHSVPPKLSQINGKVPAALADVVERAMAKESSDRFASARDFLKAIDDVLARNKTLAAAPPETGAKKPWYERWTFEAGREIFAQGDDGDACYVVETGAVDIVKTDPATGQEVLLGTVGRGAVIGEMALIDNVPRMAAARAREDTVLLMIPRDAFQGRLDKLDPVTRRLLDTFSHRIRALSEEVLRLTVHSAD